MKPLLIKATDRAVIKTDNYQFYFNKLLTLNNIKIQNDVLTKEKMTDYWKKHIGFITGGLSALFMIYNCIEPDTKAHESHMINRSSTLLNYAWGEDGSQPSYQEYGEASAKPFHGRTKSHDHVRASSLYSNTNQQEEYIDQASCFVDEETEALNEKGRDDLKDLYKHNQKSRDEVISFVGDNTGLGIEKILDKRYKYKTLNKLGMEVLGMFTFSKDHARSLIEIIASYK